VSAIAHLSLVAFILIYTEVHPFRTPRETVVPVDVIVADDNKPDPRPTPTPSPKPSPDFSPPSSAAAPQAASSPPPPPEARAGQQQAASAQPQPQTSATPAQQPAAPAYAPPEPDLTIKYHVMLGLPEDMPAADVSAGDKQGENGDKQGEGGDNSLATNNLASSLVDALRSHLRTCSKLPAGLSPSDNVAVKLRVQLTTAGRLVTEPALIEGTASTKGVALMRAAVAALSACQPYAMLPADRYGEWKVLDLSFTPRDFNS